MTSVDDAAVVTGGVVVSAAVVVNSGVVVASGVVVVASVIVVASAVVCDTVVNVVGLTVVSVIHITVNKHILTFLFELLAVGLPRCMHPRSIDFDPGEF